MWKTVGAILIAFLIIGVICYRAPLPDFENEPYSPRQGVTLDTDYINPTDIGWVINCTMTEIRNKGYATDLMDELTDMLLDKLEERYIIMPKENV